MVVLRALASKEKYVVFQSTQRFEASFKRIASSSCRPRHDLADSPRYGDRSLEAYALFTPDMRHALVSLLNEIMVHRKVSEDKKERHELLLLQRRIEKFLARSRAARPKKRTLSQCYMLAAEGTLHADVHLKLLEAAHSIYHAQENQCGPVD
jgi:hypothetical protein